MTRFRLLNLRHVFQQRLRTALSVLGIAVAAALIVTTFAAYGSLTGSVQRLSERVAGDADLELTGITDSGLDERLADRLLAADGVLVPVPLIRTWVVLKGQQALLFGADPRVSALGGEFERAVQASQRAVPPDLNGVFLGERLARAAGATIGEAVTVQPASGGTRSAKVLGVLRAEQARQVNGGFFAVAPLPLAQRLTGKQGRVDSILVVARQGADLATLQRRLQELAGGRATVGTPQLRAEQASAATRPFQDATLFLAFMALAVAGFLVFNTLSMVALERRQELGTLRALGSTRPMLLRDFLLEAAVLGIAGAAVGCPLGVLLGRQVVQQLPPFLTASFDTRVEFVLPGYAIPLATLACLGTSLLAAWLPARRVTLVHPVEAMRPLGALESAGEGERVRWLPTAAGAVLLTGGLAVAVGAEGELSLSAGPLFLLGSILLTFGLANLIARATAWLAARLGAAGRLAAASVARAPRRTWATTSIVAIAAALATTTYGVTRNEITSASEQVTSLADIDLFVQVAPPDELPLRPLLPLALSDRLAAVSGVARVVPGQFAYATIGRERVLLLGVGGPSGAPAYYLASAPARRALLDGTGVVVSRRFALRQGIGVGDQLQLPTPRGPVRVPVVDVVDYIVQEGGLVALSLDRLGSWYGRSGATFFEVTLARGVDAGSVRRALQRQLDGVPQALVVPGADNVRGTQTAVQQAAALSQGIQWVVAGAAGLAVLNTLMISVVERRRELGIVRAIGASRRLLGRTVLREAAAIGAVGGAIGLVAGSALHYIGVEALASATMVRIRFQPVPLTVLVVVAAVLVSVAGGIAPMRRAARLNVIEAIGYE
jgi:putative ABC transport system permease protein